jgi:hypothetical protein
MKPHAYCGLNVMSVNNNEFHEFKGEKFFAIIPEKGMKRL